MRGSKLNIIKKGPLPVFVKDRISVIMPTCNRYKIARSNIENILKQKYPDFEILVCDDSDTAEYSKNKEFIEFVKANNSRVRYFYTARFDHKGRKDYGIARARNYGVIEASGEFLIFLDDRITPAQEDMFLVFVEALKKEPPKTWLFGDKGAQKTAFVENCSIIKKQEMVDAGMFCERIDKYGGMTRELIARFKRQGFNLKYLPEAVARQEAKSDNWDKKNKEINEMREVLKKLWAR